MQSTANDGDGDDDTAASQNERALSPTLSYSALSRALVTRLEQSKDASSGSEHERNADTSLREEQKKQAELLTKQKVNASRSLSRFLSPCPFSLPF